METPLSNTPRPPVVRPEASRAEPNAFPRWLRWSLRGVVFAAAWIAVVGLFAVQFILLGSVPWDTALRMSLPFWLPWIALSPAVAWLAFRFPVDGPHRARHAALHLVAAAAMATVGHLWFPAGGPGPGGRGPGGPGGPGGPDGPPEAGRGMGLGGPPGPPGRRGGPPPFAGMRRAGLRTTFDLLLYGVIATGCHAVTYFRRSEQRGRRTLELEANLAQARLQALRAQLNPHFLFNALNAISTLVHTRPEAADEMIANLSELLRLSLDTPNVPEIPLARELELVGRYLDIEQVRFGPRLTIQREFDAGVLRALVPPLVLQPLVENAIRHGLEPRRGNGTLRLAARRVEDRLALTVEDDGVGLSAGALTNPNAPAKPAEPAADQRRGIGLNNTRTRLQELYGNQHRFELSSGPQGGCRVVVELPFRLSNTPTLPSIPSPTPRA